MNMNTDHNFYYDDMSEDGGFNHLEIRRLINQMHYGLGIPAVKFGLFVQL